MFRFLRPLSQPELVKVLLLASRSEALCWFDLRPIGVSGWALGLGPGASRSEGLADASKGGWPSEVKVDVRARGDPEVKDCVAKFHLRRILRRQLVHMRLRETKVKPR